MQMTLPMMELKSLLGLIHLGTPLMIYDETTDSYVEDIDDFDGYDDFPNYLVEGVRLTTDHKLMIIVKPY